MVQPAMIIESHDVVVLWVTPKSVLASSVCTAD
jgi:hypothetical protein